MIEKTKAWVIKEIYALVRKAREHFQYVSIGLQDIARADPTFIRACVAAAEDAGARRVRLADTTGLLDPRPSP